MKILSRFLVPWALPALSLPLVPSTLLSQQVVKRVIRDGGEGENLLQRGRWRPWGEGFRREKGWILCDNGDDPSARRGASQTDFLDQEVPSPLVAVATSRCEGVSGAPDHDYSLYLDLLYRDGTHLWGQAASFDTGTHGWQTKKVLVLPDKPVKRVTVNLLLRRHSGKAWFKGASLREKKVPGGGFSFDGVPLVPLLPPEEGFQVRDAAADSDFFRPKAGAALGIRIHSRETRKKGIRFWDVTIREETGKDRAVTLVYALPVPEGEVTWFQGPGKTLPAEGRGEFGFFARFRAGANGRLSRWPFGALQAGKKGLALGLDPAFPAFFRVAYHAGTRELYLAFDLGFTREHPGARLRFCAFTFDPKWGFRSALAEYYRIFPRAFRCRTPKQGLWMPFARISKVKGWRDFGFRFKEGTNETAWDDAHGILTFHYTEPMTWWMPMPKGLPRTREAALAEARRLASRGRGSLRLQARALFSSGFHDEEGLFPLLFRDEPWCNGAVWSVNVLPGIRGRVTAFKLRWNEKIKKRLYGPSAKGRLDGEYVDSSEGYVTAALDFRREHFKAARTPLAFSLQGRRPGIFSGLLVFEYVRALARDVHGMKKLMMANGTPSRLFWLAPMLDVMGTETNWNRGGKWRPMPVTELLYRRSLCGPKPFCFLMNTRFENFGKDLVEKYMKRALAFGMFPGFFSANASTGHYFTRPGLYDRDRPLFKKYLPLCKRLAEAGWKPIPLARPDSPRIQVERFGDRYLTLFNDSKETVRGKVEILLDQVRSPLDLLAGRPLPLLQGKGRHPSVEIQLGPEDLAVLDLFPGR